jgi:hypothetical protein
MLERLQRKALQDALEYMQYMLAFGIVWPASLHVSHRVDCMACHFRHAARHGQQAISISHSGSHVHTDANFL